MAWDRGAARPPRPRADSRRRSAAALSCDGPALRFALTVQRRAKPAAQPLGPPKHGYRTPRGNAAGFDLRAHLYRIAGVDFTRIDGFDALTVQTILAEVGLDPSRFPAEKHFASWLALCPDNRVTGGVVYEHPEPQSISRVATALRRAAQSAANRRSALGGFYRRLRARLGPAKAITATAHKLARIFYRMWKYREPYHPLSLDHYETKYRERTLASLRKHAASLGFELVHSPAVSAAVS
jgi:transposase